MSSISSTARLIARLFFGIALCLIGVYAAKMDILNIGTLDFPYRNNYLLMSLIAIYFFGSGVVVLAFPKQARSVFLLATGRADELAPGSLVLFTCAAVIALTIVVLIILGFHALGAT